MIVGVLAIEDVLQDTEQFIAISIVRRDYVFTYKGPVMGSIVKQQFKRHLPIGPGALAGAEFFDLYKDPREEHPLMAEFLWAWAQFDAMKARHDAQIEEHPHTPVATGEPYTGVVRLKDQ